MAEGGRTARYDLEERTLAFAAGVRAVVTLVPRTIANVEDARQLIRASGSVGAVPEPASMILLLLGAGGLWIGKRRRGH